MAKKSTTASKNTHTTLELHPLANNRTWIEMIQDNAFMMFPEKDGWRQRFIYTMLEWASKEDSLEITDFALEMKMHRSMLYRWVANYPDIGQAFEMTKLMIASRRKKGALTRKFDKDVVFKDLHKYDPEWLEINKYHSDMKKDEDKQSHTFIINDVKPKVISKEEMSNDSKESL